MISISCYAGTGFSSFFDRGCDPATGRFVSKDPMFPISGVNAYSYAVNDPVNLIDPNGLWGFGVYGSGSADVGIVAVGAGGTVAGGAGVFGGGSSGTNVGGFVSTGGFIGGPGYGYSYPAVPPGGTTTIGGAYAGAGLGGFITNATTAGQLQGPFNNYFLNTPLFSGSLGISGGTWIFSLTSGVPPFGIGFGSSGGSYPTQTHTCGGQ